MRVLSGPRLRPGVGTRLAPSRVRGVADAVLGSLRFYTNTGSAEDYATLRTLPTNFGAGEFTFEFWCRLDNAIGTGDGANLWWNGNATPYSAADWWFRGNFLLDGHNNANYFDGTFSVQVYDSGRLRWTFGDGAAANARVGDLHACQGGPQLLDGAWHKVSLVRRWSGASDATLEMWIDGVQRATETITGSRTDMYATYWDDFAGFPNPPDQRGWFFGEEKQAALGILGEYDNYFGHLTELRFWSIARATADLQNYTSTPAGSEAELLGWWRMRPLDGNNRVYDERDGARFITCVPQGVGPAWVSDRP